MSFFKGDNWHNVADVQNAQDFYIEGLYFSSTHIYNERDQYWCCTVSGAKAYANGIIEFGSLEIITHSQGHRQKIGLRELKI